MTIKFSDITGGGIPYGDNAGRPANPGIGKLYSNGESQRIELYTGSTYGWQNIVAETPGVTGYTGSVLETNTTNSITITGTNFASGAVATLIGSDGTEYIADTTTVSNLTSITATFGALSASKEPYDIRVTNPSNLYGVYYDILTVNDKPIWSTSAGSLGSVKGGSTSSLSVAATDEENNTITYALSSGSLPGGISLNTSTGALTGSFTAPESDTTYSFAITATDGSNTAVSRSFSITVRALPTGGTVTTSGGYRIHTFTSSGTFAISEPFTVQYLVIAGGGSAGFGAGGGNESGGGGAGGYRSSVTGEMSGGGASAESALSLTAGSYTVTVGAGGAGVNNGRNNGSDSTFSNITSIGGGAGGNNNTGASGGSGGGGSHNMTSGGAGTTGQGYRGGNPTSSSSAGGGGGAGAAGGDGRVSVNPATGGVGVQSSINGTATYYAGGGGGGNPGTNNYGGNGGGGNGQGNQGSLTNGTNNTGGGGGGIINGSGLAGGSGGSGVVIVRYAL